MVTVSGRARPCAVLPTPRPACEKKFHLFLVSPGSLGCGFPEKLFVRLDDRPVRQTRYLRLTVANKEPQLPVVELRDPTSTCIHAADSGQRDDAPSQIGGGAE